MWVWSVFNLVLVRVFVCCFFWLCISKNWIKSIVIKKIISRLFIIKCVLDVILKIFVNMLSIVKLYKYVKISKIIIKIDNCNVWDNLVSIDCER